MAAGADRLETLLVRLTGGIEPPESLLAGIADDTWTALDERAEEHRLQPLFHAQWASGDAARLIPPPIRESWAGTRRTHAFHALNLRVELRETVALLAGAGIAAVALKGAWLAWHAYPSPDLRPMRDIDLLLAEADMTRAWDVLRGAGYVPDDEPAIPIAEWAARYKHLPALTAPRGSVIELHSRIWDRDPASPPPLAGVMARAAVAGPDDPVRYTATVDMLAHLSVHAVHDHRLDCGPLLLADIDFLVARAGFDWPEVWRRAEAEGWARAAALTLAVTDRWRRPGLLAESRCPLSVPEDIIVLAPSLLCKPVSARAQDFALVKLRRAGVPVLEKVRRIAVRRHEFADIRGYLGWLAGQVRDGVGGVFDVASKDRARTIEALETWLAPCGPSR